MENKEPNQSIEEVVVELSSPESSKDEVLLDSQNDEIEDERISDEEEKYDDEGELSELTNEVEVTGYGNASIVGATINIGGSDIDDTVYPCPSCQTEIDASKYGKIICPNPACGFKIFRRNLKLEITQFETIEDKLLASKYRDVVARINNNLIRRRFSESYKYCIEAEEIAPREPTTWEYFTLVEFYYEIGQPKDRRKDIDEIFRSVLENIKICEANGVDLNKIDEIKGEIANRLFQLAKSRIGSFYSKSKNQKGYWSKEGRHSTIQCLRIFEDCYRLTKDITYLKEYIDELSKPYKWIVKSLSGDLINLPSCGKRFNAILLRDSIIKRVEKNDLEYLPPEVENERIIITIAKEKEDSDGIVNITFE